MRDKFKGFYDFIINQGLEISDKTNPYQCMDLAYGWVFYLNFPKTTIQHSYAYQVFTDPNATTRQYFDLITYNTGMIPQVGDIVVWDRNAASPIAGHVAVANGDGSASQFTSFDQNWAGKSTNTLVSHGYASVLGFLRPKHIILGITDETIIPQIDNMTIQAIKNRLVEWKSLLDRSGAEKNQAIEEAKATAAEYWKTEITKLQDKIKQLESTNPLAAYSGIDLITLGIRKLFTKERG